MVNVPASAKNFLLISALYAAVMVWVWTAVAAVGGRAYVQLAALQAAGFVAIFLTVFFATSRFGFLKAYPPPRSKAEYDAASIVLLGLSVAVIVGHWWHLGNIPVWDAWQAHDVNEIARIRTEIGDRTDFPFNYAPTFALKATLPLLAIYFLSRKQYALMWLSLLIGICYGLTLMQRSYPLFVTVPLALYALLIGRYVVGIAVTAVAAVSVSLAMLAANPALRVVMPDLPLQYETVQEEAGKGDVARLPTGRVSPERSLPTQNIEEPTTPAERSASDPSAGASSQLERSDAADRLGRGLQRRILLGPGQNVVRWFEAFPRSFDFLGGCGYRFLSPLLRCEFVAVPTLLYDHYFPQYRDRGFRGSANTAHFMMEYVNFGKAGLIAAGALAAMVLATISLVLAGLDRRAFVAVNAPFLVALSSTSLHTTLLSGGWMLAVLLALLLLRERQGGHLPTAPDRPMGRGHNDLLPTGKRVG